jgi:alpha-beta hydrolase superfamily lysophospholipase
MASELRVNANTGAPLTTFDGLTLTSRVLLTDGEPKGAVVIVHGFTASSACPNVEALAARLHDARLDVVTYDARGHGSSDGESTLGDDEQHDVAAAVEAARRRSDRIVLVGASMGAIAALRYAVDDARLTGLVCVSCPAEWRLPRNPHGMLAAAMTRTGIGRRTLARLAGVRVASQWTNPEPPLALAPRLRVPVTFVHGCADRFIGVRDAAQLFDAAPEPKHLVVVPDMGHAFGPTAIDAIDRAVARAFAAAPVSQPES